MQDDKTRKRSSRQMMVLIAALIILASGVILKFLNIQAVYDLPWILVIAGAIAAVYAVIRLYTKKEVVVEDDSGKGLKDFLLNNVLMLALFIMIIAIAVSNPRFLQFRVVRDILTQSSSRIIIGLGMSLLIIQGSIDLSAGRQIGVAAVLSGSMVQTADFANRFWPNLPQLPIIIPALIAIAFCMVVGFLNGFMIAKLKMLPFISTLSIQIMLYGMANLYMNKKPNLSQPLGGFRKDFTALGQKLLFGRVPVVIIYAAIAILIIWFVLNYTVFGKNLYAIGGNQQAAHVSGVNVASMTIKVFVIASAMFAIGGIIEAARTSGATATYGQNYELDAIAASVVGGVSMSGGIGKVSGIISGVFIFTIISYGLTFIGLDPNWQTVLKGLIIAATVAMDVTKNSKK